MCLLWSCEGQVKYLCSCFQIKIRMLVSDLNILLVATSSSLFVQHTRFLFIVLARKGMSWFDTKGNHIWLLLYPLKSS